MTEIVCLDSFIKTMKDIQELPDLDLLVEKDNDLHLLCGSSPHFVNQAEDDLVEKILDIELSAGYYLFDDAGLPIQPAIKKLNKSGFDLVKLAKEYSPFHYGVKSDKFCVLVSCV